MEGRFYDWFDDFFSHGHVPRLKTAAITYLYLRKIAQAPDASGRRIAVASVEQIAEAVGWKPFAVRQHLAHLEAESEGYILRVKGRHGKGFSAKNAYVLVPLGNVAWLNGNRELYDHEGCEGDDDGQQTDRGAAPLLGLLADAPATDEGVVGTRGTVRTVRTEQGGAAHPSPNQRGRERAASSDRGNGSAGEKPGAAATRDRSHRGDSQRGSSQETGGDAGRSVLGDPTMPSARGAGVAPPRPHLHGGSGAPAGEGLQGGVPTRGGGTPNMIDDDHPDGPLGADMMDDFSENGPRMMDGFSDFPDGKHPKEHENHPSYPLKPSAAHEERASDRVLPSSSESFRVHGGGGLLPHPAGRAVSDAGPEPPPPELETEGRSEVRSELSAFTVDLAREWLPDVCRMASDGRWAAYGEALLFDQWRSFRAFYANPQHVLRHGVRIGWERFAGGEQVGPYAGKGWSRVQADHAAREAAFLTEKRQGKQAAERTQQADRKTQGEAALDSFTSTGRETLEAQVLAHIAALPASHGLRRARPSSQFYKTAFGDLLRQFALKARETEA